VIRTLLCLTLFAHLVACPPLQSADDSLDHFERSIRPLLARRCWSCHSQQSGKSEGGLQLDHQQAWLAGGDSGPAILPGNAADSLLLQAVRYSNPDLHMPPSGQLTPEEIAALEQWVTATAPAPAGRLSGPLSDPADPVAGRSHWAWQPLGSPQPPVVSNTQWPLGTIDAFILAELEARDLQPAPDAEPATVLRRISFQLTGLPPSPEHLHQIHAGHFESALPSIVDELLASRQAAEHWARHWLDLARYADSNGLDENFLFREAWRYRNWVIDAFHQGLPFDQFLLQQLAGDLLPWQTLEQRDQQRIAAGFLSVGPRVLLGVDPERQKMDIADEQLDTICRAVLGQTLGCARCHDHKFDPFPTADYYAMVGIFTSTQVMQQRYMLGEQRVMERLVGLGPDGQSLNDAYELYWRDRPGLQQRLQRAEASLQLLQAGNAAAIAQKLADDADSFTAGARDAETPLPDRVTAQQHHVAELKKNFDNPPAIPARAMAPCDHDTPVSEHIRLAGRHSDRGTQIPRGFARVLLDGDSPPLPADSSGRLQFSQWLTNPQTRAGMLAARVQANRIWHHLLGAGLVTSVDNFGRTGEQPSHPHLLDYLARRLLDNGWSQRDLIREIVLSRTFRLSCNSTDGRLEQLDPGNRLLGRGRRRRLTAEALRDSVLLAAGQLNLQPMQSTVSCLGDQATAVGSNPVRRKTDYTCRSIYLPVIRNDLPEIFEVFDFANPHLSTGARSATSVPAQGLFFLNDAMVMDAAVATAGSLLQQHATATNQALVAHAFRRITGADATADDLLAMQQFLELTACEMTASGTPDGRSKALGLLCHAIFGSSRFQFLD
jgi:hypothetical protein